MENLGKRKKNIRLRTEHLIVTKMKEYKSLYAQFVWQSVSQSVIGVTIFLNRKLNEIQHICNGFFRYNLQ